MSVSARSCHLAQYILIDIAHRVAIVHVEAIDAFDDLHQRARLLDQEHGIAHETAIGRGLGIVEVLDEVEHIKAHGVEHLLGGEVAELAPA